MKRVEKWRGEGQRSGRKERYREERKKVEVKNGKMKR